jgi:hypothetical protein
MAKLSPSLSKKKARRTTAPAKPDEEKKARKPAYLRRKMAVSQPHDKEEQEADQVAQEVSRAPKEPEPGPKEDKEMISSKPVPSAQRLLRRINRVVARQAEEEEEAQPKLRRAKKPEDEQQAAPVRRSVETEEPKEEQAVQKRLRRKAENAKADEEQKAATKLFCKTESAKPEEEKPVARRIFRKSEPAKPEQDEQPVQTKLMRAATTEQEQQSETTPTEDIPETEESRVKETVEQRIENSRGQGIQLPDNILRDMEQQFGQNFSNVCIHNDPEAAELCKELNARAFAVGNDIYFAPGEYAPETESGRELLAHELTHVIQQSGGIQHKLKAARVPTTAANGSGGGSPPPAATDPPPDPNRYDGPEGVFEKAAARHNLQLKGVHLPSIKATPLTPIPVTVRPSGETRSGRQAQVWDNAVREGAGLNASLTAKKNQAWQFGEGSQPIYYFRVGQTGNNLVGTESNIRNRLLRPYWTPEGNITPFHVDHKQEYQLNGPDEDINNLWLLDASSNTSSGSLIDNEIQRRVILLVSKTPDVMWTGTERPDYETLRANHHIEITEAAFDKTVKGPGKKYTKEQIADEAIHMGPVLPMNLQQVRAAGLEPNPSRFIIYNNATGGRSFTVNLPPNGNPGEMPFTDEKFIPGFRPNTISLTPEQQVVATIRGSLFSANPGLVGHGLNVEVQANRMEGLPQAGYVNFRALRQNVIDLFGASNIQLKGASPLRVIDVAMDDLGGVTVRAQVLTDIEMIRNADIQVVITGTEISLQKTFSGSELNLPGPIKITGSSLTVALSNTRGFAVEGQANLAIDKVGTGYIGADASTGTGGGASFAVGGRFNFDPNLFAEPSFVAIAYRNNQFSGEGQLTIGQGRIHGVRSGSLHVTFNGAEFGLTGTVAPSIPGVEQATISVRRTEAEGLIYEGDLQLTANPAIRSGSIHATLKQQDEGWKVRATGTAQPAIPGIDSQLTVTYDDGAFTAEFSGAFRRGMLSGTVTVGATNCSVGEDGRPSGAPLPNGALNIYGSGSATIQIAPWLQGTAGIRFDPSGEVTVSGEIGIPSNVEIFARREINKTLLNVSTDIPIIPGIIAEIGGSLTATAGIGPGVIDELSLGITYNPAHEENTHVTGSAHLRVPADAGLRLAVRAGIGLGIPGVSVTGGLEIGGTLGIQGAAEAGVNIDWTPTTGLDLTATLSVHAQPAFTFDISGYVRAKALFFEVYSNRWTFASYTFGSDYRFGISLPIHYHEGQPFDISLDDVQFEVPDISPGDILRGLINRIT